MWIEIPSEYQYGWMKTDSNGYVYVYKHNPWRYRGVDNKSAVVCTVDLEGEDPENTYQPIEMLNQSLHKGN
ncbi:hypothetical protein ASwh1_408 [Aeromonas phage Aswh_1]|nr:hypothetical protein ASwh1_408 [Aeromonas phage Aswh_1]